MAWAFRLSSVCSLSVVCLSSLTLVHPTQRLELFGQYFAASNSLQTRAVCVMILGKKFTVGQEDLARKLEGV